MVNSLENIDKSKVYVDRIEGLDEVVEEVVDNTLIGAVSTITKSDLTAGKILVSDNNGKVAAGSKGISDLQDTLVSGNNIKTINGTSLLGSGNITVESGANTSLSNLTSKGQNIANWSTNVTNCITEIPQDIKLELNNGTLTLKAGSKVYKGDGTVVNITGDIIIHSGTLGSITALFMVFIDINNVAVRAEPRFVASGDTNPGSGYYVWFDTSNKVIKQSISADGNFTTVLSLPIGIYQRTNGVATRIDQVFNGFGYIGSTIFVLPGVKGLIPDGRNKDGTLKNIEFTTSSVLTSTQEVTGWNGKWSLYLSASSIGYHPTELEYISDTKPNSVYTTTAYWYSPLDNKLYFTQDTGATWTQSTGLHCVDYTENSSKITSITHKTAFHAVDYKDFSDLKNTVNINDSNVIHKTGNETISGVKTFTGDGWITYIQNPNVTYNIAPSSAKGASIVFTDKNGTQMGCIETMRYPSNNTIVRFNAYGANGDWASQSLEVMIDANGNTTAYAPASDAIGSIVTTTGINKSENGYVKLGNGIIIQWGKTPNIGNTNTTCTLPTPFATTNYSVTAITSAAFNENCIALTGKTTTNFTLIERGYGGGAHNVPNYFLAIGY